jgi:undecaprenyl-diphosphatase
VGRLAALGIGLVCALAYALLGNAVSHVPPGAFDGAAEPLAGVAPQLAWIFTASCLWPALVAAGVLVLGLAAFSPAWRTRALFSVILTVVAWQSSDLLKNVFARPRPAYWVLHQETSYAYSSGHAMFAVVVYGLWAYFIYRSRLPEALRRTLAPLLAAWGLAVIWSRLALGAHYPTDLIGGALLGLAFVSLGSALVPGIGAAPSSSAARTR